MCHEMHAKTRHRSNQCTLIDTDVMTHILREKLGFDGLILVAPHAYEQQKLCPGSQENFPFDHFYKSRQNRVLLLNGPQHFMHNEKWSPVHAWQS